MRAKGYAVLKGLSIFIGVSLVVLNSRYIAIPIGLTGVALVALPTILSSRKVRWCRQIFSFVRREIF
ncbi:MAG: hypothetical protein H7A36_02065 [Chlamydiales bacterium]|nr:hypothetical protein [Chlamydiales bacterium]